MWMVTAAVEIVAAGNTYDCAANPLCKPLQRCLHLQPGPVEVRRLRIRLVHGSPRYGRPLWSRTTARDRKRAPQSCGGWIWTATVSKEILFPSYDGRLHAFWLDKTEHGSWPYSVYDSGEGLYRFASEPVVADLR